MSIYANGIYFVKISDENGSRYFKFLKGNKQGYNNSALNQTITNKFEYSSKTTTVLNYNIQTTGLSSLGYLEVNQDIEVLEGTSNNIIDVEIDPVQTGDVAILTYLAGLGKNQVTITAKNTITPDSTYVINTNNDAYALFENIYVSDASNPTSYEFTVRDNASDGTFIETIQNIDIYQDLNYEVNGNKIINLNEIANVQDLTTVVYDYSNASRASGVTV